MEAIGKVKLQKDFIFYYLLQRVQDLGYRVVGSASVAVDRIGVVAKKANEGKVALGATTKGDDMGESNGR